MKCVMLADGGGVISGKGGLLEDDSNDGEGLLEAGGGEGTAEEDWLAL